MTKFLFGRLMVLVFALSFGVEGALAQSASHAMDVGHAGSPTETALVPADDVIAEVGDQSIRFSQLTKELDQGAVVGVSVPDYGTPERKQILMRLLDDAIRNRLLYLDALRKGVERDPAYQEELKRVKDGLLASLFRDRQAQGAQQVPNDLLRQQWREGIPMIIDEDALDPARDAVRADDEVLATVGDSSITWGDAKARLLTATRRAALLEGVRAADARIERHRVLDQLIDVMVMALRAMEAGLERDPAYVQRLAEFKKTGLAGFHYKQLVAERSPTEGEIGAYAQERAEELKGPYPAARRVIEGALIQQKMEHYFDYLKMQGLQVTVDQEKFERLFTREAEQRAASAGGARKE